jgi:F0F1-type ATP synthase assembly protein I
VNQPGSGSRTPASGPGGGGSVPKGGAEDPNAVATADVATTSHEAWGIFSRMVAGMLIYGALGWLAGNWLGNATLGFVVGILLGLVLGLYLSVVSIGRLGSDQTPALVVSGSQSWTARMTRARMQRAEQAGKVGNAGNGR